MARLSHLEELEAESIEIFLDAVRQFEKPCLLYSIGKDSSCLVRLAQKAFYPAKVPFPLVHIDTGWKFKEMIEFRDKFCRQNNLDLITYTNPIGKINNITPFTYGSRKYTDIMKTQALLNMFQEYGFDAAFGGARRDEEKSRAKERVFSFRDAFGGWNPKTQRPELWHLYNGKINQGESVRIFPLSNWTEVDIWQYIRKENIPVVPLYFAKKRPVVKRNNTLIMVDDDRFLLEKDETPMMKTVRFRTLGCYPLTGAVESTATTIDEIVFETMTNALSERSTRVIDYDCDSSMEQKKKEGYF